MLSMLPESVLGSIGLCRYDVQRDLLASYKVSSVRSTGGFCAFEIWFYVRSKCGFCAFKMWLLYVQKSTSECFVSMCFL